MKRFRSLLLPLDGSPESAKGAGCAVWLAERLGATLHVLHATAQPLPGREALARLGLPQAERAQVIVHQLPENAEAVVLEAVAEHAVDLVVMSARGESAAAGAALKQHLGTVARGVIERCPVPVVLLPARYREALPWTSILAAASGESAADRALEAAAQLAAALGLRMTVVHSADGPQGATPPYADAPHHEYGRRLQEMVERGLSGCTDEEARCMRDVLLRGGVAASALLEESSRRVGSVLALGWHGTLDAGRAPVLKRLLEEASCPLLLVHAPERSAARIKVGRDIDEA